VEETLHAALLAANAKIVVDGLVIRSGSLLLAAGGASHEALPLFRPPLAQCAHAVVTQPTTLKAWAIGDCKVNGTPLPTKGFSEPFGAGLRPTYIADPA
jgi:hypothetical protein